MDNVDIACRDNLSLIIAKIQQMPVWQDMQNFMFWSYSNSQLIESYILACSTCSCY